MESDFIGVFNSYKIYHITTDEYERLKCEAHRFSSRPECFHQYLDISMHRRFCLYQNQWFMYCKQALAPLMSAIPIDTWRSWYPCQNLFRAPPPNAVVAYISSTYQRVLDMDCGERRCRDHLEYIAHNIIIPKYWSELQRQLPPPPATPGALSEHTSSEKPDIFKMKDNIAPAAKKKKSIPLALKRKVWNTYIGENIGKTVCECCKTSEITQLNFSCGHIIAEFNGGELKLNNLRPICGSCNSSMGTKNMNDFIRDYGL